MTYVLNVPSSIPIMGVNFLKGVKLFWAIECWPKFLGRCDIFVVMPLLVIIPTLLLIRKNKLHESCVSRQQ